MKKVLLLLVLLVSVLQFKVLAGDAALFEVNNSAISSSFKDLNALESYVNANQGTTLSQLEAGTSASLLTRANLDVKKAKAMDISMVQIDETLKWVLIIVGILFVLSLGLCFVG